MIADRARTGAYAEALRRAVKPGSVVLDIGTGVGIWAIMACRLGARRVYAIEVHDVIELARKIATMNGCADRIDFIQDVSTRVSLPEPADVIVAEIHGALPLFAESLVSIIDARDRFLKPDGILIPRSETVWAAVTRAEEFYDGCLAPWHGNVYGVDASAAQTLASDQQYNARVKPDDLLVAPQRWVHLDYATLDSPNAKGDINWPVTRAGMAHGLSLWFDCDLSSGVEFSTRPGAPETVFGRAFFPWPEPVPLEINDEVTVTLQAVLVNGAYVWRWDTRVLSQGGNGRLKVKFQQSTFHGLQSRGALLRASAAHVPVLNEEGQIDHFILAHMSGVMPLQEIAAQVTAKFPAHFEDWRKALLKVAQLSGKYSK
jgi:protein arginine N-methyltransferase 1